MSRRSPRTTPRPTITRGQYAVVWDDPDGMEVVGPFATEDAAQEHIDIDSFRHSGKVVPIALRTPTTRRTITTSELRLATGEIGYGLSLNIIRAFDLAEIIDDETDDD